MKKCEPQSLLPKKVKKRKIETQQSVECQIADDVINPTSDVIESAIAFMKNANPATDEKDILEKMSLCHEYKKTLGTAVLAVFPRFLDTPSLVTVYLHYLLCLQFLRMLLKLHCQTLVI